MKNPVRPKILPWFTMGAGGIGLALRIWLYDCRDEKGLLPAAHPSITLLFILTALTMGVLFLCARRISPDCAYSDCFPPSVRGAVGGTAAALGIALFSVTEALSGIDGFTWVTLPVGLLAAAALCFCAVYRFKGTRPSFYLYCVVAIYLMLHAVSQCRAWGAEPQLHSYCFQLLASIFLMLAGYHRCALSIDKGNYRWFLFTSQAALFFCCVSLNTENSLFYMTLAIWMAADLCTLQEA